MAKLKGLKKSKQLANLWPVFFDEDQEKKHEIKPPADDDSSNLRCLGWHKPGWTPNKKKKND